MVMMIMMMAILMTLTYITTMFPIIDDQDDDCDFMTINLGQGFSNNCELVTGPSAGCEYE